MFIPVVSRVKMRIVVYVKESDEEKFPSKRLKKETHIWV